jgi:hypothetical protein
VRRHHRERVTTRKHREIPTESELVGKKTS